MSRHKTELYACISVVCRNVLWHLSWKPPSFVLQDLFTLRGTRRLSGTHSQQTPDADVLSANHITPRDEREQKVGKYYNEPSCISAGTQLVTTLNERYRKVATQLVETSLIDVSHYGREKKVLVRKSKPAAPSGSLSCLYLRLSVPLCRAGQGSLVAFPGRHSRDGANHRFITAPQSDSQDLSLRSPSLLSQHAAARMLNCSLQHRRGLLQVCGFFFFLKSQIYE